MDISRRLRFSLELFTFLAVIFIWIYWRFTLPTPGEDDRKCNTNNINTPKGNNNYPVKKILLWNASQRKEVRAFGVGQDVFARKRCAFTQCEIFTDRWEHPLDYYDAIVVVFNDEFLSKEDMAMPEFESGRNPNQRLVFFTQESPPALRSHYNMTRFVHFFNWTMTYALDSDIPLLYGRIIPKKSSRLSPDQILQLRKKSRKSFRPRSAFRQKTKKIAWMVSHCWTHSMRELYAKELNKYMDVDIYGGCGNFSCPTHVLHSSDPQCYDMLQSDYKFYLSFENSLCKDYVTEKFFKVMDHDIVPIVYGAADYARHAPPHSYIHAGKFKPKELADYLKLLDANETLYEEYFWWKDHFRVESSVEDMSRHGFCDLCQKLHEDSEFKSYAEMTSDWGDDSRQCA
jgi:alpha-1,3-fucosyltransferase